MTAHSSETGPIENEHDGREVIAGMRGGPGSVTVRHFRFGGKGAPTRFLILEIPPGAAEGSHVHYADDRNGDPVDALKVHLTVVLRDPV